jgi:hypothetical protein
MAGHWHLPNDVAARLDPVVEEGQASIGDEIGEAHDVCTEVVEKAVLVWRGEEETL